MDFADLIGLLFQAEHVRGGKCNPVSSLCTTEILVCEETGLLAHVFLGNVVEVQSVVSVGNDLGCTKQVSSGINIGQFDIHVFR